MEGVMRGGRRSPDYYPVADTLGIPLSVTRDGLFTGRGRITFDKGSFRLHCDLKVISSVFDADTGEAGVLVNVRGDLGLFVWFLPSSGDAWLSVLNLSKLKAFGVSLFESEGAKSPAEAVALITEAVQKSFHWSAAAPGWAAT